MAENEKVKAEATRVEDSATGMITETASGDRAIAAVAAAERSLIEAAVLLAMRNPRNALAVQDAIMSMCDDPKFAEEAIYKKPIGGKDIPGLSVRFAEDAACTYGNILNKKRIVFDGDDERIASIFAMDLQTNNTVVAEVVIPKYVERRNPSDREVIGQRKNKQGDMVYRVRATEDELLTLENNLCAKVRRNNILQLLPAKLKDAAFTRCMAALTASVTGKTDAWRLMLADFLTIGVTKVDLEKYLGHPLETTAANEMVDCKAIFNAIRGNETTWAAVIGKADEPAKPLGPTPEATPTNTITEEEGDALIELCTKKGIKRETLLMHLGKSYGVVSVRKLDRGVYEEVVGWVKKGGGK